MVTDSGFMISGDKLSEGALGAKQARLRGLPSASDRVERRLEQGHLIAHALVGRVPRQLGNDCRVYQRFERIWRASFVIDIQNINEHST